VKKRSKSLLCGMITIAMVIFMALPAMAATGDKFTDNGINYEVTDTTNVKVIAPDSGTYAGDAITIPGTASDETTTYDVTEIGASAFAGSTELGCILIADTIESIDDSAFAGCSNLQAAVFYGNAPTLGEGVFSGVDANFMVCYSVDKTGFIGWDYPLCIFGISDSAELTSAMNELGNIGGMIRLGGDIDIEGTYTLSADEDILIDTKSYRLELDDTDDTLTIGDHITVGGNGFVSDDSAPIYGVVAADGGGNITIEGGTVQSNNDQGVAVYLMGTDDAKTSTLTMTSGFIMSGEDEDSKYCIGVSAGKDTTVDISGGTVTANGDGENAVNEDSEIDGGTGILVSSDKSEPGENPDVILSGCDIEAYGENSIGLYVKGGCYAEIKDDVIINANEYGSNGIWAFGCARLDITGDAIICSNGENGNALSVSHGSSIDLSGAATINATGENGIGVDVDLGGYADISNGTINADAYGVSVEGEGLYAEADISGGTINLTGTEGCGIIAQSTGFYDGNGNDIQDEGEESVVVDFTGGTIKVQGEESSGLCAFGLGQAEMSGTAMINAQAENSYGLLAHNGGFITYSAGTIDCSEYDTSIPIVVIVGGGIEIADSNVNISGTDNYDAYIISDDDNEEATAVLTMPDMALNVYLNGPYSSVKIGDNEIVGIASKSVPIGTTFADLDLPAQVSGCNVTWDQGEYEGDDTPGYYTISGLLTNPAIIVNAKLYEVIYVAVIVVAPTINTQPFDKTVNLGQSVTLSIVATGSDLTYQWYSNSKNSATGGTKIKNATSADYTFTPGKAATTYYYCVVTNTDEDVEGDNTASTTSNVATVVVLPITNAAAPKITTQPANTSVNAGQAVILTVVATGSGELTYQWYSNTNSSTKKGTIIPDATSSTYTVPTATASMLFYYCIVTNTDDTVNGTPTATTTSKAAKVTVKALTNAAAPVIKTQPADVNTYLNYSAKLSIKATGKTLSYQWYSNTTDSNSGGTLIASATSSTYNAPTTELGTIYYYCVITNTDSKATGEQTATATSNAASVTVNPVTDADPPIITLQPTVSPVNVGEMVNLSVTATGTKLTYQWYSNTVDSTVDSKKISKATKASYSFKSTKEGTFYYYCVITNTDKSVMGNKTATTTSETATVVVNALTNAEKPNITLQPVGDSVDVNGTVTLTIAASTDSGTLTYQWYSNTKNNNTKGKAIKGATNVEYSPSTAKVGTTYYYCIVNNTDSSKTGNKTAKTTSDVVSVVVSVK